MNTSNTKPFSFEFFPAKTAKGEEKLMGVHDQLSALGPDFFSITYGAGGSTRDRTLNAVKELSQRNDIAVAPHLSCVGDTKAALSELLDTYKDMGVNRIVALRGDLPSGMGASGELGYANDLVTFIREHSGDHFHIEVAAYPETHPQATSAQDDLKNFKRKVDAGADSAITQYFFNTDAYYYFVDDCQRLGITIPIVPGIMPITNYSNLIRFSDMCGAEVPRWIRKKLEDFGQDMESIKAFGIDVITRLCEDLLAQGAPGLHFYTMNQAEPTATLWENLKLS